MPNFLFRSAVMKTVPHTTIHLAEAQADWKGAAGSSPVRLHLLGRPGKTDFSTPPVTTIEMSRQEAYAFSEWLDAVVTQAPASRGSKNRETGK